MDSLPFAEIKSPWASTPADDDVLINDLDAFPPLHLPPHHPSSSSSVPSHISSQHELQDWQIIQGLAFTPEQHALHQADEDCWEDIHYSTVIPQKSFAEIAESAGMNDKPIPNERFMRWPKHHHHRSQQRCAAQSKSNNDDDHYVGNEFSFEDIFDHTKSLSRASAHRAPYIHRRRQQLYDVKFRREIRTLCPPQKMDSSRQVKLERELDNIHNKLCQTIRKREDVERVVTRAKQPRERKALILDIMVRELEERGILHINKRKRSESLASRLPVILQIPTRKFDKPNEWRVFCSFLYDMYFRDSEKLKKEEDRVKVQMEDEKDDADLIKFIHKEISKCKSMPFDRNLRKKCVDYLFGKLKQRTNYRYQ